MPTGISADLVVSRGLSLRHVKRWSKRIALLAAAVYFIPTVLVVYVACGLVDFIRNRQRTLAMLERYFAGVRADLRRTPAAAESMSYLLDPPGLDVDIAELWQDIRDAAVLALPGWAVQMYGYAEPPPLTAERRTEIRQALGVLDAVFLGEPGVLEARQRIIARMRSAGKKQAGAT